MVRIASRLKSFGKQLSRTNQVGWIDYTNDVECDALLNDLKRFPHLFLLGVIADRQIKARRAWMIPIEAVRLAGSPEFKRLRRVRRATWQRWLAGPPALHRFPISIGTALFEGLKLVETKYVGDASAIWAGSPSSAELVLRFLEFEGIGPKIASMAVNLLSTRYDVALADHYSVDISADVHVRRVFERLGLVPPGATVDQVIFRARVLNPTFPGELDRPAFEIGRKWCHSQKIDCQPCYMRRICPTAELA